MSLTTPFAVYVHWPFCLSKCPYCDFNSHVRHGGVDEARFVRAYATEIAADRRARARPHRQQHLLRRRHAVADAAGLGGRDPRRHRQALAGRARRRDHARSQSDQRGGRRASAAIRAAGVNRVSLGVQSLDDAALKELGRLHSAQEALDAVAIARANFERYSFDLIYARPRQSLESWAAELRQSAGACRRSSLDVSTHHRARHAVLRRCTKPASSPSRTKTWRAIFTTSRRRSA